MHAKPECIPCLFRQALNTARLATKDEAQQVEILRRVAAHAAAASLAQTPARLSQYVYQAVTEVTGVADPYRAEKEKTNCLALQILPDIKAAVAAARDPLAAALHAAVAGNIIDLGIGHEFDIEKDILKLMQRPFRVNALEDFRYELAPGRRLLYLGDNAGEIVFDTLLVEQILHTGTQVTYVVKSGPVINDALLEDAEATGMTKLVPVIASGSNAIGVGWDSLSAEFRSAMASADAILGKGHGNYETCEDRPENLYFLLKAKCPVVAESLGVRLGDIAFAHRLRKL